MPTIEVGPGDPAPRVLVFNFFAGIKRRGIPLYAAGLEEGFQRVGVGYLELRCPSWLRSAPTFVLNLAFVWFEQVVAPWVRVRRGCVLTVYPYNSGGMLDAALGRSLMVIHDLMPNHRDQRGLAASYIRACQWGHRQLRRPIAAVSDHTLVALRRLHAFDHCNKYLWANPFYAFEAAVSRMPAVPAIDLGASRRTILLFSGIGRNKDFVGALQLFRELLAERDVNLRVLGFNDDVHLAKRRMKVLSDDERARIAIVPAINLEALVSEYLRADLVWVHSRAEGFGRPVIEAGIAARSVVASDILAFRRLAERPYLRIYRDSNFTRVIAKALDATPNSAPITADQLHDCLEGEMCRLFADLRINVNAGAKATPRSRVPK